MVSKDSVIQLLHKLHDPNNASLPAVLDIIKEYCLEKGKQQADIDKAVTYLTHFPGGISILWEWAMQASEYYINKFSIYELSYKAQVLLYY